MLSAVRVVQRNLVDPSTCTHTRAFYFLTPIFQYGNFVLWDADRWKLDVLPRVRIPTDSFSLPIWALIRAKIAWLMILPGIKTASMAACDPLSIPRVRDFDFRR